MALEGAAGEGLMQEYSKFSWKLEGRGSLWCGGSEFSTTVAYVNMANKNVQIYLDELVKQISREQLEEFSFFSSSCC